MLTIKGSVRSQGTARHKNFVGVIALNVLTSLPDRTTFHDAPEAFAPLSHVSESCSSLEESSLRELHIWQLALRSFFSLRNHPLIDTERTEIVSRDFSPELRIVQQVLRRILLLSLNCTLEPLPTPFEADEVISLEDMSLCAASDLSAKADNLTLIPLINMLSEHCCTCESLLTTKVDFHVWTSVERYVRREFEQSQVIKHLERRVRAGQPSRRHVELLHVTEYLTPDAFAADMTVIIDQLMWSLDQIRLIETLLRQDAPLKQALPIFTLVREETRRLVEFIEHRAVRTVEPDSVVFDALDCTSYALGVELSRVFGRELTGLVSLRQSPAIYTKVENAHGLLRDSFQQTLVALIQVFNPTFVGSRLFTSFHSRLEQSLTLRRDLWMLLQVVLQAEKDRDRRPLAPLLERLEAFREGSLRFLMYKDWESFERFMAEVWAARGAVELTPVLHRFGTYLEALFGQINMRTILAEHTFDYPALAV
jgi:hypothetical protein